MINGVALVSGVQQSNSVIQNSFSNYLEKEMAIHSGILAWRIPWMEKSMRSQSRTRLSDFTSPQPHYLLIGFLSFKIYLEYLSMSKEYKYVNLFTEFNVIKIIVIYFFYL